MYSARVAFVTTTVGFPLMSTTLVGSNGGSFEQHVCHLLQDCNHPRIIRKLVSLLGFDATGRDDKYLTAGVPASGQLARNSFKHQKH
jgi:hypothetical protein